MLYSVHTAALLSLLLIGLSVNVTRHRLRHRQSFGDGGKPALTVAIRAHGNNLEQSLLFIVLLFLLETATDVDRAWVLGLAAAFVAVRLLYCAALFGRMLRLRQLTHGLTMLVLLATTLLLFTQGA